MNQRPLSTVIRLVVVVAVVSTVLMGAVAKAPLAAALTNEATPPGTPVPVTAREYTRIAVEPSTGDVYVVTTDSVTVFTKDLVRRGLVTGIWGAVEVLAVGPDVYVTSSDERVLTVVDAATLTMRARHTFPDFFHMRGLTIDGGRLWFAYGDCQSGGVASVELGTWIATRAGPTLSGRCPTVVSGRRPPGQLVVYEPIDGGTRLSRFDTTRPAARPVATAVTSFTYPHFASFSGDGSRFHLGRDDRLREWTTSELTPIGDAAIVSGLVGFTASPEGVFGVTTEHGDRVRSYRSLAAPPETVHTPADAFPVRHGLAFGIGSRRLYVLSATYYEHRIEWVDVCTIAGDANANHLLGTAGDDVLCGRGGNDRIDGGGGHDVIVGGDGDDVVIGGADDDRLRGGAGVDTASYSDAPSAVRVNLGTASASGHGADALSGIEVLEGSDFADTLLGSFGNDRLIGGAGNDVLDGGGGVDVADFSGLPSPVSVDLVAGTATGDGTDRLRSLEHIVGSAHDDIMIGNPASNTFDGGAGNDRLRGGAGADRLVGGAGKDTLAPGVDEAPDAVVGGDGSDVVTYTDATTAMTVDLQARRASGHGQDSVDVENVLTGPLDDFVRGSDAANVVSGGGGADTLFGLGGDDQLRGGDGADVLGGDAGADLLDGGAGDDALGGGADGDSLLGGDGVDLCVQGTGTGSRSGCESTTNTVTVPDVVVDERDVDVSATVVVVLGAPTDQVVTVPWATATGSADHDDYVGASGVVTFAAGQVRHQLDVVVRGDGLTESDETFHIELGGIANARAVRTASAVSIRDNDVARVSLVGAGVREGAAGSVAQLRFSVLLEKPSSIPVAVALETRDGTAMAPVDFEATAVSVTIPVGSTSAVVAVAVVGDSVAEADENLTLAVTSVTGGLAVRPTATGRIINDD